jgi:acyl carrier protein
MTAAVAATGDEIQKIGQQVREVVAEALARDLSEVKLETILMEDLGAESLDFLDIVFKLERAFDIQITRGEMERAARGNMSDEEFAPGGVVSEAGLARLRELMPEAAQRIQPGLRPAQILSLFSVRTFANLVIAKRQGQSV